MNLLRLPVVAICCLLLLGACGEDPPGPSEIEARFDYPAALPDKCPAIWPESAARDGNPAPLIKLSYLLRKPVNYNASFAHPLLVVYAPAGATGAQNERYTHFTNAATSRGVLVAYADHRIMSVPDIITLGGVARDVARRWCVDPARIYMSGHSNGGTVATALALLPETRDGVSAIAPSAAGLNREDLGAMQCRATPIPVMVMHGARDSLFPGWGKQAAQWWAGCNKCSAAVSAPDADGCVRYAGCPATAPVLYCEGQQGHVTWPGLEARIVEFLLGAGK